MAQQKPLPLTLPLLQLDPVADVFFCVRAPALDFARAVRASASVRAGRAECAPSTLTPFDVADDVWECWMRLCAEWPPLFAGSHLGMDECAAQAVCHAVDSLCALSAVSEPLWHVRFVDECDAREHESQPVRPETPHEPVRVALRVHRLWQLAQHAYDVHVQRVLLCLVQAVQRTGRGLTATGVAALRDAASRGPAAHVDTAVKWVTGTLLSMT